MQSSDDAPPKDFDDDGLATVRRHLAPGPTVRLRSNHRRRVNLCRGLVGTAQKLPDPALELVSFRVTH